MRYLSPQRLRPVKQTSLQWHVGQQLSKDRPESLFKVQSDASDCWRRRKYSQHFLQHCTVVPLSLTRHEDKQQRNLFGLLAAPHKDVDGKQLGEGLTTEFKCAINVPVFGQDKLLQLLVCCEEQVSLAAATDVSLQEPGRNILLGDVKRQVGGVLGSSGLSCCLKRFAALAMFSGLGSDGHGCSSTRSSRSTSLTIAEAGLNKFSRATCDKE